MVRKFYSVTTLGVQMRRLKIEENETMIRVYGFDGESGKLGGACGKWQFVKPQAFQPTQPRSRKGTVRLLRRRGILPAPSRMVAMAGCN